VAERAVAAPLTPTSSTSNKRRSVKLELGAVDASPPRREGDDRTKSKSDVGTATTMMSFLLRDDDQEAALLRELEQEALADDDDDDNGDGAFGSDRGSVDTGAAADDSSVLANAREGEHTDTALHELCEAVVVSERGGGEWRGKVMMCGCVQTQNVAKVRKQLESAKAAAAQVSHTC
jgi:hypothetical protein